MINKDVTHPRMRRMIVNPRIMLLDCNLEYKKGESQVRERRGKEGGVRERGEGRGGEEKKGRTGEREGRE